MISFNFLFVRRNVVISLINCSTYYHIVVNVVLYKYSLRYRQVLSYFKSLDDLEMLEFE